MVNMYGASRAHHLLFQNNSASFMRRTQVARQRSMMGSIYDGGFRHKDFAWCPPPAMPSPSFGSGFLRVFAAITGFMSGLFGGISAMRMGSPFSGNPSYMGFTPMGMGMTPGYFSMPDVKSQLSNQSVNMQKSVNTQTDNQSEKNQTAKNKKVENNQENNQTSVNKQNENL